MSMKQYFAEAMPYIIGIGIPIGGLLMAAALPIAYDLKGSVGELKSSLIGIQKQIDDGNLELKSSLDAIQKQVDTEDKELRVLVSEKADAEKDPKLLLSRQGIAVSDGFSFAWINQSVVVFPKTSSAESKLVSSGYQRTNLTPVIYGYVPRGR